MRGASKSTPNLVKIVIIEDQATIRDLLAWACRSTLARVAVDQATDGAGAIMCCRIAQPDLILLSLDLRDGNGLKLVAKLRKIAPAAKIIVLSSRTDEPTVLRVMQARVEGFVDHECREEGILREAVRAVMDRGRYLSPVVREVWGKLRDELGTSLGILTDREQEILDLIGRGLTNSEIADQLGLRSVAVQAQRSAIMARLDIHRPSELIRYAFRMSPARQR